MKLNLKTIWDNEKYYISFILICSLTIRAFCLLLLPNNDFPDSATYIKAGEQLFNNGFISFDNVMPIYPIYTFVFGKLLYIKIADIIISSINSVLVYFVSKSIFNDNNVSRVAAIIAACYPFFIFYSISILTETLYIFLILSIFLSLYNKKFVVGSFLIVISILLRPIFDYLAIPFILSFAYFVHGISNKNLVNIIGKYIVVYILVMSSWWYHQEKKYGEFVRLNLGDGIVWYSGNNPLNKSGGGVLDIIKGPDMDMSHFSQIKDPIKKNEEMKKKAFEYIKANPLNFIKMMWVKFIRFWRLWPYSSVYEKPIFIISSILSYGVCLVLSIGFLITIDRKVLKRIIPILLFIVYLCGINMITISSIRYRLPLEPFLIIFSSVVIIKIRNLLANQM